MGFNLDYSNFYPKVWVVPASEGRYGRFCFGFDEKYRIEWARDGLTFVERTHDYQISTNFVASNYAAGQYPCGRYAVAESILSGRSGRDPVDMLRSALSAAHLELQTPTVYSNICDLNTGDIRIYYFHNYEEVTKLNLFEELKKGEARYLVESLFPVRPFVSDMYKKYMKRS